MSLFGGTVQQAPSYVTSSTETPKWMQDAIYNQIQWSTNIANTPFQQYEMPRVAGFSPLQEQAYRQVQQNQGAWQQPFEGAMEQTERLAGRGTAGSFAAGQQDYLRPQRVGSEFRASGNLYQRAGEQDITGAADPYLQRAGAMSGLGAAAPYLQRMGAVDVSAAAQPMFGRSAQATEQSLAERALAAAQPYMQAAGQSGAAGIGQYLNPYTQNVTDQIAKMGARNLQENLLPGVSDAFIRAGQFGSKRMGEFGGRAVRDTQEAILREQSQALQQGFQQAAQLSQADLARQAQLAGTAGSVAGADLSRILQGAGQFGSLGQMGGQLAGQQAQNLLSAAQLSGQLTGQEQSALANLGQTAGQLTSQEQQNLAAMAQARATAGAQQQQLGLGALQQLQAARAGDITRQMGGYQQLADLARTGQGLRTADTTALEAAGQTQQQLQQRQLDEAYRQFQEQQLYPRQQLDWLSTQIRGMAPITPTTSTQQGYATTYGPSPLSQLMSGWSLYNAMNKG